MLSQHGTVDTAQMEHPVGPDQTERGEPSVDAAEHAGHAMSDDMVMDHSGHIDGGFMSMIAITKDLPRSRDGLPMEWIDVPFGPLFPGLPGGLALTLTLDGDTVAVAQVRPGAASRHLAATWLGPAATLPERLGTLDRLAPGAYATLAWQALASAGVASSDEAGQRARIGALERVRALSHLGWLSAFGRLLGYRWLEERAALLQLALLRAVDVADLAPVYDRIQRLAERIGRTPMLNRRLGGIGIIPPDGYGDWLTGPVARASGWKHDARVDDATYRALGFAPVMRHTGDALARLEVRLGEIVQSLDLLQAAGSWTLPVPRVVSAAAEALATLEMPRGQASTHVVLTGDEVSAVHVTVPSTMHVDILPVVTESVELADSLVAIASLDISPWEIDQ